MVKFKPEWFKYKAPRYVIDVETISSADLKKPKKADDTGQSFGGAYYLSHEDTGVRVIAIKDINTGITHVSTAYTAHSNNDVHRILREIKQGKETFVAHNVTFDGRALGFSNDVIMNAHCTSELATIRGIPGSLEEASKYLGFGKKLDAGKAITQHACKYYETEVEANKAATAFNKLFPNIELSLLQNPKYWFLSGQALDDVMVEYCKQDVELCAKLWEKLNLKQDNDPWPDATRKHNFWLSRIVRFMNLRGVAYDQELCEILYKEYEAYKAESEKRVMELTGLRPTQSAKLKEWIQPVLDKYGLDNEGTGEKAIKQYLEHIDYEDKETLNILNTLMECRDASGNKADIMRRTAVNGRIHDYIIPRGAIKTGRYSARVNQVQNFPRPPKKIDRELMTEHLAGIKERGALLPNQSIKHYIRPLLIPGEGCRFFNTDLAQIEPRMALYKMELWGLLDELVNNDIYLAFAAHVYPDKKLTKGSPERDVIKAAFMALLYGRGVPGLRGQLASQGKYISTVEAENIHSTFHRLYPQVKKYWKKLELRAKKSLISGHFVNRLRSGRTLNYPKLSLKDGKLTCVYPGTKAEASIYGSKLFADENQAECRDVMSMATNYMTIETLMPPNLDVHDEILCEIPKVIELKYMKGAFRRACDKVVEEFYPGLPLDFDPVLCDYFYKD